MKSERATPLHSSLFRGYVYTGLGELDRAMDWVERAYAEGAGGVWGIKASFLFAPLRSHPRFQDLLKKINLG